MKNLIFLDVLAKDKKLKNGQIIKSYGLDNIKNTTIKQFENIKETAYYKKFYNNCLEKLYNTNDVFFTSNLKFETFIEEIIIGNLNKFSFSTKKGSINQIIKKKIQDISNTFKPAFKNGMKKIAELMREYKIETEIRLENHSNKNENYNEELSFKEQELKKEKMKNFNLEKFQKEIEELIIQQYFSCFNKKINSMFQEKLSIIYDKEITILFPYIY